MTVGDLQQERVLEGWAAIRNCPNVSQKAAPGHLFILLFARRQCSRLWRRNPIFILSFNVFFSPSHYPTLSPKLFSAAIVPSNLLFPFFFSHFFSLSRCLLLFHHSVSHISKHTYTCTNTRDSSPFCWPQAQLFDWTLCKSLLPLNLWLPQGLCQMQSHSLIFPT